MKGERSAQRRQARDLLRRVLQIGIERDDDRASRVGESREHGSVLTGVPRERDHGHPMVFRLDDEELFERPIGAPVVDIDDLGGTIERVEHAPDPCVELRETAQSGRSQAAWRRMTSESAVATSVTSSRVRSGKSGRERMLSEARVASGRSPGVSPSCSR